MRGVDKIYSTSSALAAVVKDGTVITWGNQAHGRDSRSLQAALRGVDKVYSTHSAFVAVLKEVGTRGA